MVTLKNLLFVFILLVGGSLAAFGQNDGKTPEKTNPPKIIVGDKKKPSPSPTPKSDSDEKTPKKPEEKPMEIK